MNERAAKVTRGIQSREREMESRVEEGMTYEEFNRLYLRRKETSQGIVETGKGG